MLKITEKKIGFLRDLICVNYPNNLSNELIRIFCFFFFIMSGRIEKSF